MIDRQTKKSSLYILLINLDNLPHKMMKYVRYYWAIQISMLSSGSKSYRYMMPKNMREIVVHSVKTHRWDIWALILLLL